MRNVIIFIFSAILFIEIWILVVNVIGLGYLWGFIGGLIAACVLYVGNINTDQGFKHL